ADGFHNEIAFDVYEKKKDAKAEFLDVKDDYTDIIGKPISGSTAIGTYVKEGLSDAIGYYVNSGNEGLFVYAGYYTNTFFTAAIKPGAPIDPSQIPTLADAIYKAITNPEPVENAKTYVEPVEEIKGAEKLSYEFYEFAPKYGDYVDGYEATEADVRHAVISGNEGKYYIDITRSSAAAAMYAEQEGAVKDKVGTTVMSTVVQPIDYSATLDGGTGNYYNSAKVNMTDYIGYAGAYFVHIHLRSASQITDASSKQMVDELAAILAKYSSEIAATLEVYGNVNEDLVIDQDDVALLRNLVQSGDASGYRYADANFDGTVDASDIAYLEKIISATPGNPVKVKHLNRYTKGDYYTESLVPIDSFLMTGSANMFLMAKYVGLSNEIKGIAYNGKIDAYLFPEYQTFFSDYASKFDPNTPLAYRVGGSAGYFNKELSANHINKDKVTAIITADNAAQYLSGSSSTYANCFTEDEVKEKGLSVIRLKAASTDMQEYISDLAMLSFATGKDMDIAAFEAWCVSFLDDLNGKLAEHVGVDTPVVRVAVSSALSYSVGSDNVVSTYNYVSSGTSDYTKVAVAAGGEFALSDYDFGTSSSSKKMTDLGLWLKDYNVDKIIHIKTAATTGKVFSWYGGTALTDGKETLQTGPLSLSNTNAYYNNEIYVVCGDMPVLLRIAYVAHVLYPGVFSEEWADSYSVSHSTQFFGMTQEEAQQGIFFVSMSDLGLKGGSA
ncbi:MAG: dockerin type I repeat-containing protein, partial [Candidatus Methanomethylophilaceae archaeon]|nr:dockerin type I repeat-containing protein [Candidatus Methanomethylophilaceae archaeon]